MRKYNHKISERANESLRKREAIVLRQRGLLAIAIILVVALGILLGSSINAMASSEKDISSYNKYFSMYFCITFVFSGVANVS